MANLEFLKSYYPWLSCSELEEALLSPSPSNHLIQLGHLDRLNLLTYRKFSKYIPNISLEEIHSSIHGNLQSADRPKDLYDLIMKILNRRAKIKNYFQWLDYCPEFLALPRNFGELRKVWFKIRTQFPFVNFKNFFQEQTFFLARRAPPGWKDSFNRTPNRQIYLFARPGDLDALGNLNCSTGPSSSRFYSSDELILSFIYYRRFVDPSSIRNFQAYSTFNQRQIGRLYLLALRTDFWLSLVIYHYLTGSDESEQA